MKKVLVKYSIFAGMLLAFNLSGCGIKGNPVAVSTMSGNVRIVQNLKASASDNAVILEWDFRDKEYKRGYLAIEKSELGSAGNECRDCPRTYERLSRISLKDVKQQSTDYNNFTDKKVTRGKTYYYRIMFCDDFNVCFENGITEINY